ncbi:MAG: serine/threonine protein kinase [Clostridiales bacterium]|nr:serine/threonine protein kinase [Clostridiales bacterium]
MTVICKEINQVEFRLKEDHDFTWLKEYGKVFEVFDQQTSGNICFGITKDNTRYFLKYAGASTLNFEGYPQEAIYHLKKSVKIYDDINHPSLIKLIEHGPISNGYVVVYHWRDGESLHSHMKYSKEEKYTNPESPNYRFNRLSMDNKLKCLETIIELHLEVVEKGYVAVDFYDGSLMYDFSKNDLVICDIDMYNKGPFINDMGRMWGSSRLMAPEEFNRGELVDEVTNVYLLGAMSFDILGNSRNKVKDEWQASESLYEVAKKAVQNDRRLRYQSVKEFHIAWSDARKKM